MNIIDLVDSLEYTQSNCFAHQLYHALHQLKHNVITVPLNNLQRVTNADLVICRLKQRTLFRCIDTLYQHIGLTPIVVFDQDPWHAYMDNSAYKGTYDLAASKLNIKTFALTTELWANFVNEKGLLPSTFAKMWVLPEYCDMGPTYDARSVNLGFIGTVHSYRKTFFDQLEEMGELVNVQSGNVLNYQNYLKALQNIRIFIHSEDAPLQVNGATMNLRDGLWIKDIEAASQGCFSIRNVGEGYMSYMSDLPTDDTGNRVVQTYTHPNEVPRLIDGIKKMDPVKRQNLITQTVEYIKMANKWQETAELLSNVP